MKVLNSAIISSEDEVLQIPTLSNSRSEDCIAGIHACHDSPSVDLFLAHFKHSFANNHCLHSPMKSIGIMEVIGHVKSSTENDLRPVPTLMLNIWNLRKIITGDLNLQLLF